jgi:dihydrofolate synthase / folylpolyglutamate synthase
VERTTLLARYQSAVRATDVLIDGAYAPGGTSRAEITARAERRMARVLSLLAELGNPFRNIPIVHIGGTSGKGSTSALLASILAKAGLRTGLHTSPYLQVATEKLQLNSRLIAADRFAAIVQEVTAAATHWTRRHGERLTYGEIWMGIIGLFFRSEQVDIGVLEVGAGGRFDLTNVISPVLSVVTSVGLDHIQTLGDTIEEIAWHKAGIIKPGVPLVTAVDDPNALPALFREAELTKSRVTRVIQDGTFAIDASSASGVRWHELADGGLAFSTVMPGRFQAVNAATAVAAARELASNGFAIPEAALVEGIAAGRIPGRAEYMQHRPLVLLDGAHNPQKVAALATDLPVLLPVDAGGRRIAVLGMLESKSHIEAMDSLIPHVDVMVLTSPHVLAKESFAADRLAALARSRGFTGQVLVEPQPRHAIDAALAIATTDDAILVTGSLYLVGNIRGRWQPDDEIVVAQTQWPRPGTEA